MSSTTNFLCFCELADSQIFTEQISKYVGKMEDDDFYDNSLSTLAWRRMNNCITETGKGSAFAYHAVINYFNQDNSLPQWEELFLELYKNRALFDSTFINVMWQWEQWEYAMMNQYRYNQRKQELVKIHYKSPIPFFHMYGW